MKQVVSPDVTYFSYSDPCTLDIVIKVERAIDPDVSALYEVARLIEQGLVADGCQVTRQPLERGESVFRYHVEAAQERGILDGHVQAEDSGKKVSRKARSEPQELVELRTVLEWHAPIIKGVFSAVSKKLLLNVLLVIDGKDFEVSAADVEGSERVGKLAKRLLTQDEQLVVIEQSQFCLHVSVPKRLPTFRF